MPRHFASRRRFLGDQVRVELGRAADGLARVVDDEVEARAGGDDLSAERLDARRVAQVETEDLEAPAPVGEVGFQRVACGSIARKTRGDDQVRAGAQELESGLVSNLHAAARQQCDASPQIRQLRSCSEVHLSTGRAEMIVEGVDGGVGLLAGVAGAIHKRYCDVRRSRFVVRRSAFVVRRLTFVVRRRLAVNVGRLERRRRKYVRSGHDRAPPQRANPGRLQEAFLQADVFRFGRLAALAARAAIGNGKACDRSMEPPAIGRRQFVEQPPVGRGEFQQLDGAAYALDERQIVDSRVGWAIQRQHRQRG